MCAEECVKQFPETWLSDGIKIIHLVGQIVQPVRAQTRLNPGFIKQNVLQGTGMLKVAG